MGIMTQSVWGGGKGEGKLYIKVFLVKRSNIDKARFLRRNQTDAERKLWRMLRNRNICKVKFRRQYQIDKYILDFYVPEYRLAIEADGGQHYSIQGDKKDKMRERNLNNYGIKVLRFNDNEILKKTENVLEKIYWEINYLKENPSPQSSPHRGEEVQ